MKNQNVGKIENVVLSEVQYPEYQRGLKNISARIAKNLILKAVGTPKLSRRKDDGSLNCLDGMQRIHALMENGYETWRCEVIECADVKEEAEIFQRVNQDRETVNTYDRFKAALIAKDPVAVKGSEILAEHNIKLGYSFGLKQNNEVVINCPAAVYKCVQRYGEENFTKAISMMASAWPGDPKIYKNNIIVALCKMCKQFGDRFDGERFTVMIGRLSSRQVFQALDNETSGTAVVKAINLFLSYYNRGLRTNKLVYESGKTN